MSWALIWICICCLYLLKGSLWENVEKYGKIDRFSRRIWPDRGNTARADMAGLGSIGLTYLEVIHCYIRDDTHPHYYQVGT